MKFSADTDGEEKGKIKKRDRGKGGVKGKIKGGEKGIEGEWDDNEDEDHIDGEDDAGITHTADSMERSKFSKSYFGYFLGNEPCNGGIIISSGEIYWVDLGWG